VRPPRHGSQDRDRFVAAKQEDWRFTQSAIWGDVVGVIIRGASSRFSLGKRQGVEILNEQWDVLVAEVSPICNRPVPAPQGLAGVGVGLLAACSQGALGMARPRASEPIFGAPPKPAMREGSRWEGFPCRSICTGGADLNEHVAGERAGNRQKPVRTQRATGPVK